MKYKNEKDRILNNINMNKDTGCWDWMKYKNVKGYGVVGVRKKSLLAHRFSYSMFVGEIPRGAFVCHTCDNPSCVNPAHLFIGNNQDNMDDMRAKGRSPKGVQRLNAVLSDDEIRTIRHCWSVGAGTQREIGYAFGLNCGQVHAIVHNKIWKHVKGECHNG